MTQFFNRRKPKSHRADTVVQDLSWAYDPANPDEIEVFDANKEIKVGQFNIVELKEFVQSAFETRYEHYKEEQECKSS